MSEEFLKKSSKIENLINCASLQEMLDEAYKILGHPTLAHSMEYQLLAATKNIQTDDPIWQEYVTTGTVSKETIDFFQKENFIDVVSNINTSVPLLSEHLPYDRLFGKLFIDQNIQVGCMCTLACFKPLSEDDPALFEQLRQVVSNKLSGKTRFRAYGYEYQKWLISALIGGAYDKKLFSPHVANLYNGLGKSIYIAVIDISLCEKYKTTDDYIKHLRALNERFKYFSYGNLVITILSADNKQNITENTLYYNPIFLEDNVFVGKSECFENLFEFRKYFLKAKDALERCKLANSENRIFE